MRRGGGGRAWGGVRVFGFGFASFGVFGLWRGGGRIGLVGFVCGCFWCVSYMGLLISVI